MVSFHFETILSSTCSCESFNLIYNLEQLLTLRFHKTFCALFFGTDSEYSEISVHSRKLFIFIIMELYSKKFVLTEKVSISSSIEIMHLIGPKMV